MIERLHQLLPAVAPGDAVTNDALLLQRNLREWGIGGDIFAAAVAPALRGRVRSAQGLPEETGIPVIYHLSIGYPDLDVALAHRPPLVLRYHNITPERYYRATNPEVAALLRLGRHQLAQQADAADAVVADSHFNAAEAAAAGAAKVRVIAPYTDVARLHVAALRPAGPPVLLGIGRFSPHKGQDLAIRTLAACRHLAGADARLVLVGTDADSGAYVPQLERLAHRLGVAHQVEIVTGADDRQLGEILARATTLLVTSHHEGFCVPLVEAMSLGLPVVALAAGATAETAATGAVIIGHTDPLVWGMVVARLHDDREWRDSVVAAGLRRVQDFAAEELTRAWLAMLEELR